MVGNVYKFAFWLTAHLANNPKLMEEIRQEVAPAVRDNGVDEKYLLEQCPKLDSLSLEILRLTVTSPHARVVIEPTVLNGKLLKPGNKIMVSKLTCIHKITHLTIAIKTDGNSRASLRHRTLGPNAK